MRSGNAPVFAGRRIARGISTAIGLALCLVAAPAAAAEFVLAISWQPAFCETMSHVPECHSQHAGRFDASHFALHGLWPRNRSSAYCGVARADIEADKAGRWRELPMPALPADLRARLDVAMPGTQSGLDRHEWLKHGTCIPGTTAQSYYAASLALLDAVNASPVRDLFAGRVGAEVSAEEIRAAFDTAFGAGAGERVRLACRQDGRRRLVVEITIGLSGALGPEPALAALIAAARPTKPGCPGGVVDAVGLQ